MAEMRRCYRHPDRETAVSCSECERPICTDCMVFAPVGIRCPEHGRPQGRPQGRMQGRMQGRARVVRTVQLPSLTGPEAIVTKLLIAVDILIYLIQLAQGAGVNANSGSIFENGALYGPLVAHGDWWRLITTAFLHYGPIHLLMNMVALYWFGGVVEAVLGRGRFLLLYLASGLAGSAGALVLTPLGVTVGASGAIFGMLGALLIIEWMQTGSFAGNALTLIVLNLAFSAGFSGHISLGGHVGGLIGGVLGMLALSRFGRGHPAYSRPWAGIAAVVAIGAISVAIAYWKVHGYA